MNEAFLRDFFHLPRAEKSKPTEPVPPRSISIECYARDPIEIRAENIVKMIGFYGGDGGSFSIPQISPAAAALRVIKVLRKYADLDGAGASPPPPAKQGG